MLVLASPPFDTHQTTYKQEIVDKFGEYSSSETTEHQNIIRHKKAKYTLIAPLKTIISDDGQFWFVESKELGLIATGPTIIDAKREFNEEFDYLYRKLNSLEEHQLSKKMNTIKIIINTLVDSVE